MHGVRVRPPYVLVFDLRVAPNLPKHEAPASCGPWEQVAMQHSLVARVLRLRIAMVVGTRKKREA